MPQGQVFELFQKLEFGLSNENRQLVARTIFTAVDKQIIKLDHEKALKKKRRNVMIISRMIERHILKSAHCSLIISSICHPQVYDSLVFNSFDWRLIHLQSLDCGRDVWDQHQAVINKSHNYGAHQSDSGHCFASSYTLQTTNVGLLHSVRHFITGHCDWHSCSTDNVTGWRDNDKPSHTSYLYFSSVHAQMHIYKQKYQVCLNALSLSVDT